MLKYLILILIIDSGNCFSQKSDIYIKVPTHLKEGVIIYDLHPDKGDSLFTVLFSDLPNKVQDASFILTCERTSKIISTNTLPSNNIFSPLQIMDSLKKNGRSFFRKNNIYVLFEKGFSTYIHNAKGEYIFMDYRKE